MILSSDYSLRLMGKMTPQPPEDKNDVTNLLFNGILNKIGQQQVYLDVSRCSKLTANAFLSFHLSQSLMYLDVSYTQISELNSIANHCKMLKAINLSGTKRVISYEPLSQLLILEVLSLRSSAITSIDSIKDLICLRSLDIGKTAITTITPISRLTRLEELLLDGFQLPNLSGNIELSREIIDIFHGLNCLRLINLCETPLNEYREEIRTGFKHEMHLERASRRELFFDAIINNNREQIYSLISQGQDIHEQATPDDYRYFYQIWKRRCTSGKLKSPFFLCDIREELFRPNALHIAIYFNSYDCMVTLLDMNIDKNCRVWFGDVKGVTVAGHSSNIKKLVEIVDPSVPSASSTKVMTCSELIIACYQRNIHRLTENMVTRKISNWKSICLNYSKRLSFLLNSSKASSRLTLEEINLRKSFAADSIEFESSFDDGMYPTTQPNEKDALNQLITGPSVADNTITGLSELSLDDVGNVGLSTISFSSPSGTIKQSEKQLFMQRKPSRYQWRNHAMTRKLLAEPIRIIITNDNNLEEEEDEAYHLDQEQVKSIELMGRKSYWLESRSQTITEKVQTEEIKFQQEKWHEFLDYLQRNKLEKAARKNALKAAAIAANATRYKSAKEVEISLDFKKSKQEEAVINVPKIIADLSINTSQSSGIHSKSIQNNEVKNNSYDLNQQIASISQDVFDDEINESNITPIYLDFLRSSSSPSSRNDISVRKENFMKILAERTEKNSVPQDLEEDG
eukprot:gene8123-11001_t